MIVLPPRSCAMPPWRAYQRLAQRANLHGNSRFFAHGGGSVRRSKVYEISESELEKLENGPPGQVHLSFALALLPAALTVFITVQTVEIKDNRVYHGYWIAFWLLFV